MGDMLPGGRPPNLRQVVLTVIVVFAALVGFVAAVLMGG